MLANIKLKAIEELKMIRADESGGSYNKLHGIKKMPNIEDDSSDVCLNNESLKKYENCVDNKVVYDDKGVFLPYSAIINTLEQHKALCSVYKT